MWGPQRPKFGGFWILGILDFGFWGFWILEFGDFGFWILDFVTNFGFYIRRRLCTPTRVGGFTRFCTSQVVLWTCEVQLPSFPFQMIRRLSARPLTVLARPGSPGRPTVRPPPNLPRPVTPRSTLPVNARPTSVSWQDWGFLEWTANHEVQPLLF